MVASYIIWYIVVGNAAGVIVFLWIWMLIGYYALLKFPKFVVVGKFHILTTMTIYQQLTRLPQPSSP